MIPSPGPPRTATDQINFPLRTGQVLHPATETRYHYYSQGSNLRLDEWLQPSDKSTPEVHSVHLFNGDRFVSLRETPNGYSVEGLRTGVSALLLRSLYITCAAPFPVYCSFETPILDVIRGSQFEVTKIEVLPAAPSDVRVHWTDAVAGEQAADPPVELAGTFLFNRANSWALKELTSGPRNNPPYQIQVSVTYDQDGMPIGFERRSIDPKTGRVLNTGSHYGNVVVRRTAPPPETFALGSFGLPEDLGYRQSPGSGGMWWLVLNVFLIVAILGVFWIARGRKAAATRR